MNLPTRTGNRWSLSVHAHRTGSDAALRRPSACAAAQLAGAMVPCGVDAAPTSVVAEIQLHEPPPVGWEPPLRIKVEHADAPGDLAELKRDLEATLREKLIFRAEVELVAPNALPRYEYKAKLVREVYKER